MLRLFLRMFWTEYLLGFSMSIIFNTCQICTPVAINHFVAWMEKCGVPKNPLRSVRSLLWVTTEQILRTLLPPPPAGNGPLETSPAASAKGWRSRFSSQASSFSDLLVSEAAIELHSSACLGLCGLRGFLSMVRPSRAAAVPLFVPLLPFLRKPGVDLHQHHYWEERAGAAHCRGLPEGVVNALPKQHPPSAHSSRVRGPLSPRARGASDPQARVKQHSGRLRPC